MNAKIMKWFVFLKADDSRKNMVFLIFFLQLTYGFVSCRLTLKNYKKWLSKMKLPERIFVTGTDTGIGKTFVSAVITAGRNGYYWKPVQSGLEDITDTQWVKSVTSLEDRHFIKEAYRLNAPLSPHVSASMEGIVIDPGSIVLPEDKSPLVVEGAGGVMVPLNSDFLIIDLIKKLGLPVIVVARSGLGTINHTLLTIEALRHRDIEILGIVLNGKKNEANKAAIEEIGRVRVIAEIEHSENISRSVLIDAFERFFNG